MILAAPDDPHGYAVYADWLEQQGDPRAELIQIQLARESAPTDAALEAREKELLAAHQDRWLAGLLHYPIGPTRGVQVVWRRGFVHGAQLETSYQSTDAAILYRELSSLPVARFLRVLRLGAACTYAGGGDDDVSILEALRDHPFPVLRQLGIDCLDRQLSWTHVGDISIANPSLQTLESLEVIAGRITLGAIDLPALKSLRLETGGLRASVLESIAAASWPNLESLVIYFGTEDYGGTCMAEDVLPILDGANLPRLRTLALCNGTFADDLPEVLAHSRILPRLERLDLSKGTLGVAGARAIAKHADAFAHLASLDLSENYLTAAECTALARVAASVDVSAQKSEGEYGRYVTVSE